MSLQQKLDVIREGFEKSAPPETIAIMHGAADDLRRSGITDRTLKEGAAAPLFELKNSLREPASLGVLLKRGPVVMTFFRGNW